MTPLINDHLPLTSRTTFNGRTLPFDWPALHIPTFPTHATVNGSYEQWPIGAPTPLNYA